MSAGIALLAFVTLQRLGELAWARRNTARLLARGAVEAAPEHYKLMVLMHGAWLLGLWLLASGRPVDPRWALIYAMLQAGRAWVLVSLGERWTTRILVLPGAPLVRRGPYRFMNHPNYVVVAAEIAVLPLAFGLAWYAAVFSLLNAAALAVRIPAEDRALREVAEVRGAAPDERARRA
jgi:methyltransferase